MHVPRHWPGLSLGIVPSGIGAPEFAAHMVSCWFIVPTAGSFMIESCLPILWSSEKDVDCRAELLSSKRDINFM